MKGHPWCHTALCDYLQPIWSFLMFWVINSSPQLSGVDMSIIPICRCVCGSFSLVSLPAIYLRGANTWRTFFLPSTSFSSDNELQGIASNSWEWLSGAFTYLTLWDEIGMVHLCMEVWDFWQKSSSTQVSLLLWGIASHDLALSNITESQLLVHLLLGMLNSALS